MVLRLLLLSGGLLLAQQDWKTATTLAGVDFNGLTPAQKIRVLKVMRASDCPCGCGRKIAQCRVEDPQCSYSLGLGAEMVKAAKQGKNEDDIVAAGKGSQWGTAPDPNRILENPVKIPVAGAPVAGPGNAAITLVEFSDFQCPYCITAVPEIEATLKAYPTQVKLVFKQFPLEIHSDAYRAATAALAAQKQGKFWQMHNALFAHHENLSQAAILDLAKELGLDSARLQKDMESKEVNDVVAKDLKDGNDAGVEGTPTIFINGQRFNRRIELDNLKPILDEELKKPAAHSSRSALTGSTVAAR